jgi:hypothetical protein
MRLAAILGLALLAVGQAQAQEGPPLRPMRDVAVTYRVEGGPGAPPGEIRMAWLAAEAKMRMDLPGGIGWSVVDTKDGSALMVQEGPRVVMRMPADPARADPFAGMRAMRLTRGGTETLLGHRCTVWTGRGERGEGEACVTADGVVLRSRGTDGQRSGGMVAVAVDFAAQDPARFQPPAGYRSMALPPGMPMPPPGAR